MAKFCMGISGPMVVQNTLFLLGTLLILAGKCNSKNRSLSIECIFLVANYLNSEKIFFEINKRKNNKKNNFIFDNKFPAIYNERVLKDLTIENRNSSEVVWKNSNL